MPYLDRGPQSARLKSNTSRNSNHTTQQTVVGRPLCLDESWHRREKGLAFGHPPVELVVQYFNQHDFNLPSHSHLYSPVPFEWGLTGLRDRIEEIGKVRLVV